MLVARVVSGIGMGFVNSTVPVIQAEFSPKSSRGRFVCMQLSTLNFGKWKQLQKVFSHSMIENAVLSLLN